MGTGVRFTKERNVTKSTELTLKATLRQQEKRRMNKRKKQRREAAKAKRLGSLRKSSKPLRRHLARSTVRSAGRRLPSVPRTCAKRASTQSVNLLVSAGAGGGDGVLDIMCCVCNKDGTVNDTVRCDECQLSYHFNCLDPPMKKSQKVRGYIWHCEACDMLDSSGNLPSDYT